MRPRSHSKSDIPHPTLQTLGLDVGGANLKAADDRERARSVPFALWKNPAGLAAALGELVGRFGPFDRLAVTMTGELCDCFETKAQGVSHILAAVDEVAAGRPVWVWQTGGEFVDPATAREFWRLTAAANWHATATFVGRVVPAGPALLIDVGSTTADLVPIEDGVPVPAGRTDLERLTRRELVYRGVGRTDVAFAADVDVLGEPVLLPIERFATTDDAFVALGAVPERPTDRDTADGRPATRAAALGRLARAVCCDRGELDGGELLNVARQIADRLVDDVAEAVPAVVGRLSGPPRAVAYAGAGAFLADRLHAEPLLAPADRLTLSDLLSPALSACLPAHAVARLCAERC